MADPQFCYVITRGRVTGIAHEIEIWFAREPDAATIYMLSGGADRSDWVKNIRAEPAVTVRIADETFDGAGRVVDAASDEDALARRLLGDDLLGPVIQRRIGLPEKRSAGGIVKHDLLQGLASDRILELNLMTKEVPSMQADSWFRRRTSSE